MIMNPIKKRREEKRLTQVDLALLVGVSQVYISQFETGGLIPSESQTKKITEILGIDIETLNRELHQFYEARRKELMKRIKEEQGNARISVLKNKTFKEVRNHGRESREEEDK